MFPSKAFLSFLLASTFSFVDASPLSRSTGKATLSFVTTINGDGALNIADKDRARAYAFQNSNHLGKRSTSFGVTNAAVTYTAQVGIGSPATDYTLLIDTGSSNTWIGADKAYVQTSTSKNTGNSVSVSYGSGGFSGEEWTDTVTLAPGLVIKTQSIGVASSSSGLGNNIDGILGVGPVDLTSGTVSNTNTVPTVSDNLRSQGTISQEVLGVYFVPSSEKVSTGTLTFGGYDTSVTTGSINYVSLTTTSPASQYWGINESITYGGTTILSTTAGIVDTGTTLILIASDAFQKYQSATGAVLDNATGLLALSSAQYSSLKTLSFKIGGKTYNLTPNGQIWPRSLNSAIGGSSGSIYLVVGDIGTPSGQGLDFINGYTFLERFYSVFDTTYNRVGLATTAFTNANTN